MVLFATVRRGMYLEDGHGQRCLVEYVSRKYQMVVTRRYEDGAWWDCVRVWTPEWFNCRPWKKLGRCPKPYKRRGG